MVDRKIFFENYAPKTVLKNLTPEQSRAFLIDKKSRYSVPFQPVSIEELKTQYPDGWQDEEGMFYVNGTDSNSAAIRTGFNKEGLKVERAYYAEGVEPTTNTPVEAINRRVTSIHDEFGYLDTIIDLSIPTEKVDTQKVIAFPRYVGYVRQVLYLPTVINWEYPNGEIERVQIRVPSTILTRDIAENPYDSTLTKPGFPFAFDPADQNDLSNLPYIQPTLTVSPPIFPLIRK